MELVWVSAGANQKNTRMGVFSYRAHSRHAWSFCSEGIGSSILGAGQTLATPVRIRFMDATLDIMPTCGVEAA